MGLSMSSGGVSDGGVMRFCLLRREQIVMIPIARRNRIPNVMPKGRASLELDEDGAGSLLLVGPEPETIFLLIDVEEISSVMSPGTGPIVVTTVDILVPPELVLVNGSL